MSINRDFLRHYGVIGMKWGVRRLKEHGGEIVRKKGEDLHHITDNSNLQLRNGILYVSFTKKDNLRYRGDYSTQVMVMRNVNKVFDYKLSAAMDLVSPNKKKKSGRVF